MLFHSKKYILGKYLYESHTLFIPYLEENHTLNRKKNYTLFGNLAVATLSLSICDFDMNSSIFLRHFHELSKVNVFYSW